jgi:hypothetical protein
MSVALCAIAMVVCMVCIFGIGMIGKLTSRFRRRSEGPGS